MFVLRNAWAALLRHRWRTVCIMVIVLAVTLISVFSLAVTKANATAQGSTYEALKPSAVIRMNASQQAKRNGADPNWTKNYLTWSDYTTYATAAQSASLQFNYSLTESVPVRQTDKFKSIAGTADQKADATGGEFNFTAFYTQEAQDLNEAGSFTIVSGKGLTYATADSTTSPTNGVLISQALAQKNNVKVNDTITIADPNNASKTHDFKVQGIYTYTDAATTGSGTDAKLSKDNRDNAIYTAYAEFSNAGYDANGAKGWAIPDLNIIFTLNSPADYTTFVNTVTKAKIRSGYEISSPTLNRYEESIAPLKHLAEVMNLALYAAWIAGGILLLGLIALTVAKRGREIGNALVLGVSKPRIAWQFMLEVFIPVLTAFAIGMLAAGFVSGPLGSSLSSGHATGIDGGIIVKVIGWGLTATLALAVIASLRASLFRTSQLFRAGPDTPALSNTASASTSAASATTSAQPSTPTVQEARS